MTASNDARLLARIAVEAPNASIPSVILVDDQNSADTVTVEGSARMMSLTSNELDIIKLLRCRPVSENPRQVEQWKQTLLGLAERELRRNGLCESPLRIKPSSGTDADVEASHVDNHDGDKQNERMQASGENFTRELGDAIVAALRQN